MPKLLEESITNAAYTAATRRAANQLFNGRNLARYEEELSQGLAAVSKRVAGIDAPFTGITRPSCAPRSPQSTSTSRC